jgi:heat shock protein HtpX
VFKRLGLLIVTNFAILMVLSVVLKTLEALGVFGDGGLWTSYGPLLVMATLFGFGGAFVSLFISKWVAKWTTRAQVLERPRTADEAWLLETVRRHADAAGIAMPEVAVYDAPEMNAFATGPSRNNSLVAVSTGLLRSMRREEVEAVLGHEVAHVANGDMVTLTLIQGVLNTFVIFLSRVIGGLVDGFLNRDGQRSGPGIGYWVTTIVLDILLGFLAAIIVAWFSRQREFRADAGSAQLLGRKQPMINALARLGGMVPGELPKSIQAFGITSGVGKLFSTHPPIEERIARLQAA